MFQVLPDLSVTQYLELKPSILNTKAEAGNFSILSRIVLIDPVYAMELNWANE